MTLSIIVIIIETSGARLQRRYFILMLAQGRRRWAKIKTTSRNCWEFPL